MASVRIGFELQACAHELPGDAAALSRALRAAAESAGIVPLAVEAAPAGDADGASAGLAGALLAAHVQLLVRTRPADSAAEIELRADDAREGERAAGRIADALAAAFGPARRVMLPDAAADARAPGAMLLEWLDDDSVFGVRAERGVETVRSPHQLIEVFETRGFGRLYRLDGRTMTSERDEFFCHEPLVHCAAIAHDAPRSALVIGGGDGGSSEELLKHACIRRVVMAELDAEVIGVSRRWLGGVHRGAFDDPRLEVRVGDGFEYVRDAVERFDLVVLDLTDPDTPARRLYTREFFSTLAARLERGGALSLHLGSPVFQPGRVRALLAELAPCFRVVRPLGHSVPLWGSYWASAVASDSLDPCAIEPAEVDARVARRGIGALSFYNGDVHRALFALPNYFRELLPEGMRPGDGRPRPDGR